MHSKLFLTVAPLSILTYFWTKARFDNLQTHQTYKYSFCHKFKLNFAAPKMAAQTLETVYSRSF